MKNVCACVCHTLAPRYHERQFLVTVLSAVSRNLMFCRIIYICGVGIDLNTELRVDDVSKMVLNGFHLRVLIDN